MDDFKHIKYIDSLPLKEQTVVYRIFFSMRKVARRKNKRFAKPWTPWLKLAVKLHQEVKRAQDKKRLKRKTRHA